MTLMFSLYARSARHVIAVVFCLAGSATPAWAQFETRATRVLSGAASSVTVGDFNGDGKLDVAIMDGQLSVLLGNGDGTFQAPLSYPNVQGSWVTAADFNRDGKLDLVVNIGTNKVGVLLGSGDGTFRAPLTSGLTDSASFGAVGDFNNDHTPDLAVIDGPYVSVLLGNADGTFQPPIDNDSFGAGAHELTVGDFSNDHKLGVAVVGYFGGIQNLGILLGNGDGTLRSSLTSPLANTPGSITAADFNHDGNLDLAIGEYIVNGVTVFLGNGDGSFQPGVLYGTTGGGGSVSAADFRGNGELDLVFSAAIPPGVNELVGNGDGTFQQAMFFPAGGFAGALGIGDFNGDHRLDAVYADRDLGVITLLNTGALTFSPSAPLHFLPQLLNTGSAAQVVTLTNNGPSAVSIHSITASGQFQATDNCGGSVAAGGVCSVSVVSLPTTPGRHPGLITLLDGASTKPQVIELSGRGTQVALSPSPMSFASQKVGTRSSPQQLFVTNTGSSSLIIAGVDVGGGAKDFTLSGVGNCTRQALAAGASCHVAVTFAPKKVGVRRATVFVNYDNEGSPATGSLSGTGS